MKWLNNLIHGKNTESERDATASVRPPSTDMRSELGLQSDGQSAVRIRPNKVNPSAGSVMHPEAAAVYDEEVRLHDLKVRARRRLIGAAVLLTAAFIILPWVFDDQRKQTASQVSVVVPDKNVQFDVKNPRATDDSLKAAADKAAADKSATDKSATDKSAAKPVAPNDLLYPPQANSAPAQVTPPKAATTKPETTPPKPVEPAPAAKPVQKYAVHIGLVTDGKELDTLLTKLRAAGVEPQLKTVVVDGVSKTRVRLGLFDTQAQAAAAAAKAKGSAKNPVVIAITPEP